MWVNNADQDGGRTRKQGYGMAVGLGRGHVRLEG